MVGFYGKFSIIISSLFAQQFNPISQIETYSIKLQKKAYSAITHLSFGDKKKKKIIKRDKLNLKRVKYVKKLRDVSLDFKDLQILMKLSVWN